MARTSTGQGGGWEDVLAAIAGGLAGGAETYGDIQRTRERAAEEERLRSEREERLRLQRMEIEQRMAESRAKQESQAREDASAALDRDRERLGPDVDVPAPVVARARRAGRSDELTGAFTGGIEPTGIGASATAAAMGSPYGGLALPRVAARFVATAQERSSRDASRQYREYFEQHRDDMPPATAAAIEHGIASGKYPTLGAPAFEAAGDPIADAVARERALLPVKLEEVEGRERIQARYRPTGPPVKLDDPSLPNGVMDYVAGQLVEKYGNNREAAAEELFGRALPKLREAHPRLDVAKLRRQFDAIFPKPTRDGLDVAELAARLNGEEPPPAQTGRTAAAPSPAAGPPIVKRPAAPATASSAPAGSGPAFGRRAAPAEASPGKRQAAVGAASLAVVRQQLQEAVDRGDAEQAARLRDELLRLKGR